MPTQFCLLLCLVYWCHSPSYLSFPSPKHDCNFVDYTIKPQTNSLGRITPFHVYIWVWSSQGGNNIHNTKGSNRYINTMPEYVSLNTSTCTLWLWQEIWAASWQNQQSDCAPSEGSDQPGHPPSLIRVFTVHLKKAWVLSYLLSAQRRLWSDWADAQADLSPRWAHTHFVCFVMRRLIW